jgi:hypothetical protein
VDSFEVPVRPHVHKYLLEHLGTGYSLSTSDHFGIFLFHLLRRPTTDARKNEVVAEYAGRFVVHYGAYKPEQYGLRQLTGKTIYEFNNFVHALLIAEMHAYVDMATDHGNAVKYSILAFMTKYALKEEDLGYDALLKSYQRFNQGRKTAKKKVTQLTPRKMVKQLKKDLQAAVAGGRPAMLPNSHPGSVQSL